MGHYVIELDPEAAISCKIIFLFEKHRYKHLPQEVMPAVDIFQHKIVEVFQDLEYVKAYLDDLLCVTHGSVEDHLQKLDKVLLWLKEKWLKLR